MRISDWSSDVCSSDLLAGIAGEPHVAVGDDAHQLAGLAFGAFLDHRHAGDMVQAHHLQHVGQRSEEHTSELQSLMRISYAVFCLKKKKHINTPQPNTKCLTCHNILQMHISINN